MPIGGETIGRAYIRILADGRGLNESIRKEMKDAEPAIEVAGREHEKAYSKAYNDQLANDKNFEKSYRRNLDKAFGSMSARAKLLSGNIQQNIANAIGEGFDFGMDVPVGITPDPDMDRRAKLIGERAGANIAEGLNEGMDPKKIDFGREIRRAIKQVDADIQNDLVRDWRHGFTEINDITNKVTGNIKRDFRDAGFAIRESSGAIREFDSLSRVIVTAQKKIRAENEKNGEGWDRSRKKIDGFADGLGKAFGHGSRNNFLNFMGSVVRGIAALPGVLINVGKGIADVASGTSEAVGVIGRMGGAFADAAQRGEGMAGALTSAVAELLATGVPGLIAVSAAVLLIGGSIGVVTSLVGALAGALIGLASTIGFGLIGVLGGAAAALLPVAAAIGGVALAIHGIGGLKSLKDDIKPLKATFDDLSKTVAKSAFASMGDNIASANVALKEMKPLAQAVGDGLGNMIDGFVKGLESPAWTKFRNTLVTFLPGAMTSLGHTISNIFGGVAGVFRALTTDMGGTKSIATQFLDTIQNLTGKFSKWANSVKGQRSMHNFFQDAWESAQKLGHFITVGIGLIGRLLGAAKPVGDNLFDQMTNKMQEWSNWLANPANQGSIQKWFGNALAIATSVGQAIGRLSDAFAKLDSPTNRTIGRVLFSTLVVSLEILNKVIQGVGASVQIVYGYFKFFLSAVRTVMSILGKFPSPFRGLAQDAVKAIDAFNRTAGSIGKVSTSADNAKTSIDGVTKSVTKVHQEALKVDGTKVDFNTAPALKKLGLVVVKTQDGKRMVEQLDGHPVTLNAQKAFLAMQILYEKTHKADSAAAALSRKEIRIITSGAVRSVNAITQAANEAVNAVLGVDGLYVNVNTSSAQASLNQLSHTADVVTSKLSRGSQATMAAGGMVVGPTRALIGEAGPEAVVPLNRPLYLVDPAVRALSAIAQGLTPMAAGGVTPGKVTNVGGITIVTPTKDPAAVAQETVNRLVGVGY